ncbi:MAG: hypothetical protein ACE5HI_11710 [bacterium]
MILSSIKSGLAQMWANKRMVLVFFIVNLFFGVLLMLPFRSILNNFVGHSLMGAELAGRLNMDFFFDFLKYNSNVTSIFQGLILIVPAVYWLVSLFLSGGAFAVFASGDNYSASMFWGSAAKYFGRFFRLVLWSLPVFAILFCLQFIETGIQRLVFGSDPYQYVTYWGAWIKFGLRLISILLFGLVLDYARIHAVLADERKMRISLWHAIKFAFGKITQTFSLKLILFFVGVVALVIYNPLANVLAAPNAFVVLLLFLLQQLYMFFRMMLRLTLFSSQMVLYKEITEGATAAVPTSDDLGIEGAPA